MSDPDFAALAREMWDEVPHCDADPTFSDVATEWVARLRLVHEQGRGSAPNACPARENHYFCAGCGVTLMPSWGMACSAACRSIVRGLLESAQKARDASPASAPTADSSSPAQPDVAYLQRIEALASAFVFAESCSDDGDGCPVCNLPFPGGDYEDEECCCSFGTLRAELQAKRLRDLRPAALPSSSAATKEKP